MVANYQNQICCGTLVAEEVATSHNTYQETTRVLRNVTKKAKATATVPAAKTHICLINEFAKVEGLSDNKEKKLGCRPVFVRKGTEFKGGFVLGWNLKRC